MLVDMKRVGGLLTTTLGLTALLALLPFGSARAETPGGVVLSLALVGHSQAKQLNEENFRDELNIGGAALAEFAMGQYFGIETGVFYVNRQYDAGSGSIRLIQQVKRLHVPVLARVWLNEYFSVGAGTYASFRVGSTRSGVQLGDVEAAVETSAGRDLEIGYEVSGLANLAISNKTGVFIEGRYLAPFAQKAEESAGEIFGLVGVKLHLY